MFYRPHKISTGVHKEYCERSQYLNGGDIIRLMHTESEGFLAADLNYDQSDNDPEVYIRQYLGSHEEERKSISSLWEIEIE